ncbi:envelope stress response membrane protein PspB [Providencia vermicola]|jgi:phage shock protein B|uniref:envelope stress response membrane protein PspB n=1 Tax=Providencia TaxID=586 RepID=UPI00197F342B|nr:MULTISPECIES: envelope stress response membrane protein PspB [Providencia]MDR2225814.1 envelope stress response membrane protein PspB [Providencia sp.]ELR5152033.1 envelope stress response membrane protein PspB [Providencia rettgeri]ELR5232467.1 envelope stress response membrane protein PspB [Providencia rettgeri]ELR5233848.1 envelope stress response membrane protein PspB [Providencia rettgeri]MBN4865209.1 envelope stress response membrane protein PspB [Providencia stuartii]
MGYVLLSLVLIIFVIFVLPVWLWLHYSKKNNGQGSQLTENEVQRLMQLAEQASRMQQRIKTLEDILDAEHPNWRQK